MFYKCFIKNLYMATIKAVVLKHQQKKDGTFNVKVRVTHNRDVAYIATPYFVVKKELNRKYEVVDDIILTEVTSYVSTMRKALIRLGIHVESFTAKSLAEYLEKTTKPGAKNKAVDLILFMADYIDELKNNGRSAYKNYGPALRRLKEYAGETLLFENMTASFLEKFEKYLADSGTGKRGIQLYMSCYRTIFNEARKRLNDDDKGVVVVKNYPFTKYKIKPIPDPEEKAAGIDLVKQLYFYTPRGVRETLAKDMFFLSFYLVGMNAVDIYSVKSSGVGRITYQRRKTKEKRSDNAEISIRIEPEVMPLLEKYRDDTGVRLFNLYKRYASIDNFNYALSNGFRDIRKALNVENLTFYSARHSWASIASHNCDIPDDRIAKCLNHVSMNYRITNRYIKKDWSIIDASNRKVIDFVCNEIIRDSAPLKDV